MSIFKELKRRNVFKVAAAYIIVGWLIMQAGDTLGPALHLPEWVNSLLAFFLILGFPLAMFFAWAYEMTPDGIKKETEVEHSQSITRQTGRKLDFAIIAILVVALGYFTYDKFILNSGPVVAAVNETQTAAVMTTDNRSIAVLPFVNMSDDSANEYFSDGLSEELLNLLAKIPELRVAARTSSFSFRDQSVEIPEIAKRLHVDHVLEGSVRKSGNQVRITAQLIKADDGFHLWSETYDRQLDNIFQMQDEIAAEVVNALKVTLLGAAPKTRETDPKTYQLYLEGRYFTRQGSADAIGQSIELFKQALAIDPGYVPALAALANSYMWYAGLGAMPIQEGNALADEAIATALAIDPTYAPTYGVRGMSRVFNKFDFAGGMDDWQHALQLDPSNADAVYMAGNGSQTVGRFRQAIDYYMQAIEMDPVQPAIYESLAGAYYFTGEQDKAETTFRKLLSLSPEYTSAHYRLGRVLLKKGDTDAALQEMQQESQNVYSGTGLAMAYYALGNIEAADKALASLIADAADHAAFQIAEVYGFRGEVDKALQWLNRAYEIHDGGLPTTLGNPAFESLISDPGWEQFLEKIGLAEAWNEMPPEHGGPTP